MTIEKASSVSEASAASSERVVDEKGPPVVDASSQGPITLSGYVEAFYQWNVNQPSSGITGYRGFDNRHNAFTLANVALGAHWKKGGSFGQITAQWGHTPSSYYGAEPFQPAQAGAGAASAETWKFLQEAYAGYAFGEGERYSVAAGLFLSPIGPESMAIRENWNWSRSNLFVALPFYHTGVRAAVSWSEALETTIAIYNGWNSVVDNNQEKSVAVQARYAKANLTGSLLYFGGVERLAGDAEGRPWRHLFDAHGAWMVSAKTSLMAHASGGFEQTRFGTSGWAGGALYARTMVVEHVYVATRVDGLTEHAARGDAGTARRLFYPAPWVASVTGTVDVRPTESFSVRLEGRQDRAGSELFVAEGGGGDGANGAALANRSVQSTVTLGLVAGF